jgi:hypothetical protein
MVAPSVSLATSRSRAIATGLPSARRRNREPTKTALRSAALNRHEYGTQSKWECEPMTVVTTEVSPLNCSWVTWTATGAVCTRTGTPRPVGEHVCSICDHWTDSVVPASLSDDAPGGNVVVPEQPETARIHETCPNCGAAEAVLLRQDPLVRTLRCCHCHQHWLATSPWPTRDDTVE